MSKTNKIKIMNLCWHLSWKKIPFSSKLREVYWNLWYQTSF